MEEGTVQAARSDVGRTVGRSEIDARGISGARDWRSLQRPPHSRWSSTQTLRAAAHAAVRLRIAILNLYDLIYLSAAALDGALQRSALKSPYPHG